MMKNTKHYKIFTTSQQNITKYLQLYNKMLLNIYNFTTKCYKIFMTLQH